MYWLHAAAAGTLLCLSFLCLSCSDNAGQQGNDSDRHEPNNSDSTPGRIISLSPSITEILYALDLGTHVVGNTKFCDYPPEAAAKQKVGGYHDPNYEAIVSLRPDLIILLKQHEKARRNLEILELNTLIVSTETVEGIHKSIMRIGESCARTAEAERLLSDLKARTQAIKQKTAHKATPRVLVCIGRNMGTQGLKDVYIAADDGFYSRLIELAGGTNVYKGSKVKFPKIAQEGLLTLNPDVIIDMAADLKESNAITKQEVVDEWQDLKEITAVKNERVYVFTADYVTVPGPRYIRLLEKMARAIHPDVEWEK